MQKKKGISLIVLVITIIVMIILAATIIISLNNSGIIGKANKAVNDTNEQEVNHIAQLAWSEAYLNGERTVEELTDAVTTSLTNQGIDISKYLLTVTTRGVAVALAQSSSNETINITVTEATASTKTTGNVPLGNYDPGDEYIIHIGGEDRIFFVLGTSGDNVNLIMNQNIGSTVNWCDDVTLCKTNDIWDNTNGPITANAYLASQTSNWEVKPYIPTKEQIEAVSKLSGYLQIWLYDYLKNTTHSVSSLLGYWTASPTDDSHCAWSVLFNGREDDTFGIKDGNLGVRPVITIPKALLG